MAQSSDWQCRNFRTRASVYCARQGLQARYLVDESNKHEDVNDAICMFLDLQLGYGCKPTLLPHRNVAVFEMKESASPAWLEAETRTA